jgi:galactose mutarotase-like enzyme
MTLTTIASAGLSAEIDALGAQLSILRDDQGRDLLWDGDPAVWKGRAPILFPIVGNLNGGQYRHAGKTYQLPRHGFARTSLFSVAQAAPDRALLRLAASDETRAVYPFDFMLEILFALADATLTMTATVTNAGVQAMPASFGYHPAFRWPLPYGEDRAAHRIRFAEDEPAPVRYLDAEGLILPQEFPTPIAGRTLVLADELFTRDAIVMDRIASQSLTYGAATGPQLAIGFPDTPQLGLWTKPGAGYVCIEPWQGHADPQGFHGDLTEKPGMMHIAPGQSHRCTMTVTLA